MRRSVKTLVAGAIATAALVVSPLAAFAEDPVSESGSGVEGDVVTMNLFNMTDIHGHIEKSEYKGKVTEAGLASTAC